MQNDVSLFLGTFPKTYCLSLAPSTDRRIYMECFVAKNKLKNLNFIDAATPEIYDKKAYEDSKVYMYPVASGVEI